MSTKKFEAVNESGRALRVIDRGEWVQVIIGAPDERDMGIALAPSDAPALALAILEAAGVEPGLHEDADFGSQEQIQYLTYGLKKHVEAQERTTAEAEAQAKLEAEALGLYKAAYPIHADWDWESVAHPDKWLAVARRAREMRAEK